MHDILIENGLVIDGSGGPAYAADVAVKDGRILGLNDDIASRWGPRVVDLLSEVSNEIKDHPVGASS